MKKSWIYASLIASALVFTACSNDDEEGTDPVVDTTTSTQKTEVKETYAKIVYASYEDSYNTAVTLKEKIDAFVDNPTQATHDAAKQAWLDAREPYGQTEAYRFAGGPIDDENGPEGLLNAWPLDEVYIDYINGDYDAGIINDTETYPTITAALLTSLNEAGGEANISVGYHAIEFLLWGQDNTDPSEKKAGQRSYTDYVVPQVVTELKKEVDFVSSIKNQERRGQYLKLCTEQLVDNLEEMVNEWKEGGAYRTTFLALDNDAALKNILTGIGVLSKSELAGERVFVAYENQDQEDEHSCFSDNTHRDVITNAVGVQNVYLGSYTRVDGTIVSGTSLSDLVAAANADLNTEVVDLLEESVEDVENIPVPFDNAISDASERPLVLSAVTSLQNTGDKIAEAAKSLGITINTGLPD
ncbi:MAG: hypothetical protein GY827_06340 [Cytophagales bacterium]|nr:hypothetical protein [Cytophagales bacterium]